MKALILAAGTSTRLRPLTDETPKCLLNVGDKSILALAIDNLIANNITELVVVTGYLEQQIKDFITSEYKELNVNFIYNEVYASTNNIYSLWLAKKAFEGEDMLLLDSDIIFHKDIISKLIASNYKNCLALKQHELQDEEIKVKVDAKGRILEIGKTVNIQEAIGESIGIEKFDKSLVKKLFAILDPKIEIEKQVNIFYEAAFQDLMDAGEDVYIVDVSEHICMEIDTASDLEVARKMISGLT
ncbi:MAG: phosphocholine cytidylyltransferase family protein [Saprospiraceae bacterium]|nr:phosphocholine cytidylyltransferase family protein [Saprospiraceae bacterium]MBK8449256.1 phosphocholine cytidylyltransferase family protein [Saprospiraceae bacterium]MBK9720995.1 phosphocholine cytidylyltransferase family protein [Saprospiraceae bacterium]